MIHPDVGFSQAENSPPLALHDFSAAFSGRVAGPRVSISYHAGMVVVALAMAALPLLYLGMIIAAGWAVFYWGTHFTFLLQPMSFVWRVWLLKAACYFGPLLAGVVIVFFMIKPLFARRARHAQPLALNPVAEPLLYGFIGQICKAVGAPQPQRIDLDCQLSASASFRRGGASFLGNELVLTIGLPLVASLNVTQFAGVLAHEFGHFTQGAGMRLTYVIRRINGWFARVVHERDAWDVALEEWANEESGFMMIVVYCAQVGVWFSRLLLGVLMLTGHLIGSFMLRQMEYDADAYGISLAGSETFETTMQRLHLTSSLLGPAYGAMRATWNKTRQLPDNFPAYLMRLEAALPENERNKLEGTMGLQTADAFAAHPSNGDRIRRARLTNAPGIFNFDAPATSLFSNFDIVAKQITLLHYGDDLGIPVRTSRLVPVTEAS